MNYYVRNRIDIIEVPAKAFRIKMVNARKQSAAKKNYVNAGFFATFSEGGEAFTLPVGHVVCVIMLPPVNILSIIAQSAASSMGLNLHSILQTGSI